jgi:Alpha/beta hydrolase domain
MKINASPRCKRTGALVLMGVAVVLAGCGSDTHTTPPPPAVVPPPPPPPPPPAVGIVTFTINSTTAMTAPSQMPTFGGMTFGPVGTYDKIRGTASGTLDPKDPKNAVITDIALAPVDANGLVEYNMDFYILKPSDLTKGNHKVFFELPNRGGKQYGSLNLSSGGNDPTTAADAGTAFLQNQGYTIVWGGWEPTVSRVNNSMGVTVPVAVNADGSAITGPVYEYIENDNATTMSFTTTYTTNTTDTTMATLTVKAHLTDPPMAIPSTGWTWTSTNTIALLPAGTPFTQSFIYELVYTAKQPWVAGIGLAAIRDLGSFLRTATTDATSGTANPLAGDVTRMVSFGSSQPARTMNDFVWLGFNQDINGKQVFDGVFNWVAGGDGVAINYRFEQSGMTERNRQQHFYPEGIFPFAYATITDPLTGKTDGRDSRCTATNTCPLVMNIDSANEYWVKAGSMLHSDATGNDLPDAPNFRTYLISGSQHGGPGAPNSLGVCAQFVNPTDQNPALRALFVDLDEWIGGTAPPASMVPSRAAGTAVFAATTANSPLGIGAVDQTALGWPTIPGVLFTGLVTVHNVFDWGPQFDQGIIANAIPVATGKVYPNFVSKVDVDGNEIAGVRLPPVTVPVSTTAGWNLRSTANGGPDGCESSGTSIPFAPDVATRMGLAAGVDPRLSLTERYGTHAAYAAAVAAAANNLAQQRFLLPMDVQTYITNAQNPIVVTKNPVYGSYMW